MNKGNWQDTATWEPRDTFSVWKFDSSPKIYSSVVKWVQLHSLQGKEGGGGEVKSKREEQKEGRKEQKIEKKERIASEGKEGSSHDPQNSTYTLTPLSVSH